MDKIKSESKTRYERIEGIISEYVSLLKSINTFEKKWAVTIIPNDNQFSSVEEVESELRILKPQIMRITKKGVIFGKTSVGKSIFINALLKENILPSGYGSTSNMFVEIEGSSKDYNYLLVDGSDREHPVEEISNLNDEIANQNLADRSHLHLFYDRQRCELLNEDVVIVDTPGMDNDVFMDTCVEDLCKDADVIILLVSAVGTFSVSEKAVISKYKTIFSKLTVLIVYTFWDKVHKTDLNGSIKQKHIQNAKTFLCDELNFSEETALRNIYFLSGKERLQIVSQDSRNPSIENNDLRRERNENFDVFVQFLKRKLSENAVERIHNYLEQVYSNVSRTVSISEFFLREKCFVKELVRKIQSNLPNLDDVNGKINNEISIILTRVSEELIEKGRDAVKNENKKETNQGYKKLNFEITEGESTPRLETLFVEIVERFLVEIKCNIIKLCSDENKEIDPIRRQILEELYFPTYLDVKDQMDSFDMIFLEKNLLEINKKIKTGMISTICATGGFSLLTVVTGGASLVALGLVELGLVAGAVIGTVGIAGVTASSGTSFGIINTIKNPFGLFWKEDKTNITTQYDVFKLALLDSYSSFVKNLETEVLQLLTPISTNFRNIENKLNAFKEDLRHFMNLSVIL